MARVRKVEADFDRQIITGMIVSTPYLKAVSVIYKPEYLLAPFAVSVAGWCLNHLQVYGVAPGKDIQKIFNSFQRDGSLLDEHADSIEQFLENLSDEYSRAEKFNVDLLLDQTEHVFRARAAKFLVEDIEAYLSKGELLEVESTIARFRIPERMKVCGSGFRDTDATQKGFEAREEPLFRLPGAIGDLMNSHFVRGGLMALLGREKVGKTWLASELKLWALKAKCNVAMFQLGDLTEGEYRVRQGIRIAGKSNEPKYCREMRIPMLDCFHNQRADCQEGRRGSNNNAIINEDGTPIEGSYEQALEEGSHIPCTKCYRRNVERFIGVVWYDMRPSVEPLTWREADRAIEKFERRHKLGKFKLAVYPNTTMNVKGIFRLLELWQDQENFVPDVIILDYADIMAPEDPRKDERAQENDRWKALRKLSQERYALVITVTQSNRLGYDVETMQGKHVSEDKRKLSHVTAFFSLNQTPQEKRLGILRIAPIMEGIREGYYDIDKQVNIIQCLQIGRPIVSSFYQYKHKKKKEEK